MIFLGNGQPAYGQEKRKAFFLEKDKNEMVDLDFAFFCFWQPAYADRSFEYLKRSATVKKSDKNMFFGYLFLAVGLLLLLKNLGVITAGFWNILWPLIFIGIGLKILIKRKKGNCWYCGDRDKRAEEQ